jgi:hypothetical protein
MPCGTLPYNALTSNLPHNGLHSKIIKVRIIDIPLGLI